MRWYCIANIFCYDIKSVEKMDNLLMKLRSLAKEIKQYSGLIDPLQKKCPGQMCQDMQTIVRELTKLKADLEMLQTNCSPLICHPWRVH